MTLLVFGNLVGAFFVGESGAFDELDVDSPQGSAQLAHRLLHQIQVSGALRVGTGVDAVERDPPGARFLAAQHSQRAVDDALATFAFQ